MNNMSSAKKIIIFSSAFGLIFFLTVIFLVMPLYNSIKEISGRILTVKRDLASFENEVLRAEQFQESYNDLEINPEKINDFLVNPSAPIELIKFFEALARETGLNIKISPVSSLRLSNDPWDSMSFSMELSGEFPSVVRFLEKTESSHYFIKTQKFYAKAEKMLAVLEIKVFTKDQ